MAGIPPLSLHVPEPEGRPGDEPDFSRIVIPAAGSVACITTVIVTRDSTGRALRRLREHYAPGLLTALDGSTGKARTFTPDDIALTITMTRIMWPFMLLVSLAALVMGILNARNIFGIPALASCFFNLGSIIAGGLVYAVVSLTTSEGGPSTRAPAGKPQVSAAAAPRRGVFVRRRPSVRAAAPGRAGRCCR